MDAIYPTLIKSLLEVAHITRAKSATAALRTIDETTFKAIIITDGGLAESNQETREVIAKIKSYIENGGLAIVGLHFAGSVDLGQFGDFWRAFGLSWKRGSYHRSTFRLNPSGPLPESIAPSLLPEPYSMKVLHIKNAERHERLFVPTEDAVVQSLVSSPTHVDQAQTAVAGARLESQKTSNADQAV
ncbi:hypothetical protein FE257_002107 [Aspergillus nanangensis]|uniref:Uncharacterized protein n=1 Tax=Aspergillus nanangensis TaxID=2582783 RepID=A0AAD4GX49_ASPNN|nr:hypothetical protein FE257_002107 [Aspergillus nanangensis]